MNKNNKKIIFNLFIREKKWNKILNKDKDVDINNGYYSNFRIYVKVFIGLISIIYIKKNNVNNKIILVWHEKNELINELINNNKKLYKYYGTGLRAMYYKYGSMMDLEALYYLINYDKMLYSKFRKYAIGKILESILNNKNFLLNNLFILNQDYTGAQSILGSLSEIIDIKIVAIQHGLMPYSNLKKFNIYPCKRIKTELVFNEEYKNIISKIAGSNKKIINFGPPISYSSNANSDIKKNTTILFISSGDLLNLKRYELIHNLNKKFKYNNKINFILRPHPQEYKINNLNTFILDNSPALSFLSSKNDGIILMGFYSTLLYYGAYKGFRTIWLTQDLTSESLYDLAFVGDIPNANIININKITQNYINDKLMARYTVIGKNSIADRFAKVVEIEYPEFYEK